MVRVVIESPLSAADHEGIKGNQLYAKRCMWDCIKREESPYASHLLFVQDELMDDLIPHERALGMKLGFEWGAMAHKVVVYIDRGITPGMQAGIDHYRHCGIPIEYRYIYPDAHA